MFTAKGFGDLAFLGLSMAIGAAIAEASGSWLPAVIVGSTTFVVGIYLSLRLSREDK